MQDDWLTRAKTHKGTERECAWCAQNGRHLVEDTRLDADCAASILTMPPGSVYWYCRRLQAEGGPARAVANLTATPAFRAAWRQDRSVEKWAITQHPGGYLRRKGRA